MSKVIAGQRSRRAVFAGASVVVLAAVIALGFYRHGSTQAATQYRAAADPGHRDRGRAARRAGLL